MIGGELFKAEPVEITAAVQPADRQTETRQTETDVETHLQIDKATDT